MSRLCPTCGAMRAHKLTRRLESLANLIDSPRLITVTLRSSVRPLKEQLEDLVASFSRLRKSKEWKRHVHGGVYIIEVTWNAKRLQWHPHVHALCEGHFWQGEGLTAAWKKASNGSTVTDIRAVHSRGGAARYLTQYVTKSQDARDVPDIMLPEWAEAISGARMCQTWGTLHACPVTGDEMEPKRELERVESMGAIAEAARRGDDEASAIIAAVCDRTLHLPWEGTESSAKLRVQAVQAACMRLVAWYARRMQSAAAATEPEKTEDDDAAHQHTFFPAWEGRDS